MLNKYVQRLPNLFYSIFQVPCGLDFGRCLWPDLAGLQLAIATATEAWGLENETQAEQGKRSGERSSQSPDKDGEV